MNLNYKHKIAIASYTLWCGLGFKRGLNAYEYSHNNKYNKNECFIYSNSIIDGIFGVIMYANPILFPLTLHKELYRLEINIRNLENEKKSSYFNELF
jgi:hypothetical protein